MKKFLPLLFLLPFFVFAAEDDAGFDVLRLADPDLARRTAARNDFLAICLQGDRRAEVRKTICEELDRTENETLALFLIECLQYVGTEEAVGPLTARLDDSNLHVSEAARRALAANPSGKAAAALRARLMQRKAIDPVRAAGYAEALGERKDVRAVPLLVPLLASSDERVFSAAAKALSDINVPEARKALAERRERETGRRRHLLTSALFETGCPEVFRMLSAQTESIEVRATAWAGRIAAGDLAAGENLLGSPSGKLQDAAVLGLIENGTEEAFLFLAQALPALPPLLQLRALGGLQASGNRSFARFVRPLLASPNPLLRNAAAETLGRIGTVACVNDLLADGSQTSIAALGRLDAPGVDERLREMAKCGDSPKRIAAIRALAARGRTDGIEDFFRLASDPDPKVAEAAAAAIGSLGGDRELERSVSLMLQNEGRPVSRALLAAAVGIVRRSGHPEAAVGFLSEKMKTASPTGISQLLQLLFRIGSPPALPPVLDAAENPGAPYRKIAFKLLCNWPDPCAIDPLIRIASTNATTTTEHVLAVRGATRLLAGNRRFDMDRAARALAASRRPEERRSIIELFAARTPSRKRGEALEILRPYRDDPDLGESLSAALKKLGEGR